MKTLIKTCDLLAHTKQLEDRIDKLEKDIKVLFEITNKIPPKYYKLQDNDLNENNA